jgi:hypothetical protein
MTQQQQRDVKPKPVKRVSYSDDDDNNNKNNRQQKQKQQQTTTTDNLTLYQTAEEFLRQN